MKERYTKPSADVEVFKTVDVITTSTETTTSGGRQPIKLPDIDL